MYAKDVSKKVKTALYTKQKQGKYIGTKAPYGYIKDPNDKHHLLIDERYAPVIRKIFDLYLNNGMGCRRIALQLNAERIPRPCVAAADVFPQYAEYTNDDNGKYRWTDQQISSIIRNPVYAGHVRGQYRPRISIKSNKTVPLGSQSFIIPNMHEPIIPPEKCELAQEILSSHRHEKVEDGYVNIWSGLLRCADCDHTLTMQKGHRRKPRPNPMDMVGYACNNYRTFGTSVCSLHWIEARDLYEAVLADIQLRVKNAVDHDEKMVNDIINKMNTNMSDNTNKTEKELRKAKRRLSELDKMFSALYEDKVNGNVSEHNYKQLAAVYEAEQLELEQKISGYEENLRNTKVEHDNADKFVAMLKEYAGIKELNAAVLHSLIDKIVIHETEIVDDEKVQKIEIYYQLVGKFDT